MTVKTMRVINVYLPPFYIKKLDELVAEHKYPNRNEAIRFAIRDFLNAEGKFGA